VQDCGVTLLRTCGALLVASIILLVDGCSSSPPNPGRIIVAFDRSGSTTGFRADQLACLREAKLMSVKQDIPLEVFSYDYQANLVYGPEVPYSDDALFAMKRSWFVPDSGHPLVGTRPAALLEAIAAEAIQMQAGPNHILILSDGDNDFYNDRRRIKAAAVTIAKIPDVRLSLIGIHPENRAAWQHLVGTALGSRLDIDGPGNQEESTLADLRK